jgi:transposase-like protein
MDDLAPFCCQNPHCSRFGERDAGNLSVCARYGKQHTRLLYCSACKDRFSERKGTAYFRSNLPDDQVQRILAHLADGCGIRQTARLVEVHRDTVLRLAKVAGRHAHDAHDELVAFSPSDPRDPVRREVGLRGQEAEELRPHRPGR